MYSVEYVTFLLVLCMNPSFFLFPQLSTYLFLPPLPLQGFEEDGTAPQEHTEQLVTPGSRSEMEEFERFSSALSQYSVSLHLPTVCLHLPSKRFLEILYNRCKSVYCMRLNSYTHASLHLLEFHIQCICYLAPCALCAHHLSLPGSPLTWPCGGQPVRSRWREPTLQSLSSSPLWTSSLQPLQRRSSRCASLC